MSMSEAPPPEEAPAEDGPLSERLQSKAWKVRGEALTELTKVFTDAEEGDAIFAEHADILKKAVADSNVNVQEKGIEATHAFLRKASVSVVGGVASAVISKAVEKGFVQAKCKAKAQELALLMIEAESGEAVTDELMKGCTHKQPKIAAASAECLRMAVQEFGLRAMGPQSKAIVKLSATLFDSTVAPVRAEAKPLAVELHKYMGAALRPSYDNLRPAQQKEIDEAFEEAGKPQPTRKTRTEAAKAVPPPTAAADGQDGTDAAASSAAAPAADFDPLEFLEPVEVLGKLPKDFCDKIFTLAKWQEKKEMLDVLLDLAKAPKLCSGDYHELVKTLKKLMSDSMVVIVATSVTALGLLGTGLQKEFSQATKMVFGALLDKFKEKDKRVIEAVHSTIEVLSSKCVALADLGEDFSAALGPKGNPKSKAEILKFLQKTIKAKTAPVQAKPLKPLLDALSKCVEDSSPDIRDGACGTLAALLGACGMPAMKATLDALDEKKKKKVLDMAGGAGAGAGGGAAAAAAAPAAAAAAKPVKKSLGAAAAKEKEAAGKGDEGGEGAAPAPAAAAAAPAGPKRTVGGKAAAKPAAAKGGGGAAKEEGGEVDLTGGTAVEELDRLAEEEVGAEARAGIASANWKERLAGMEGLEGECKGRAGEMSVASVEAVVRVLQKAVVERKETNFQVFGKAIGIAALLAQEAPKFSKRAAHWLLPALVEKLGDVKLKTAAGEALLTLSEAVTPQFVLAQLYEAVAKHKAPKVLEATLLAAGAIAADFGVKLIKPKPLLDFAKGMLEVANPAVKKAAIEVLVGLRRQLGGDIRKMLSDVKPALLATIDEAFAKVEDEAPDSAAPKRQVKGAEEGEELGGGGAEGQVVSLAGPVAAHLKMLGDTNWKERQAAIIALDETISKAKPLGCAGPYMEGACGELWAALKARLKDTNKNLATQVLQLLAKLAAAVGPPVDRYSKFVMPNMLALISDGKKSVRDAVLLCLSAWAREVQADTILKYLPAALAVDAPAGREDAVKWTADFLAKLPQGSSTDLSSILRPVMECLEHRVVEVRLGAEKCLVSIFASGSGPAVAKVLRDLKPAQLKTIKPLCDKAEKAAAAAANAAAASATAANTNSVAAAPAAAAAAVQEESGACEEAAAASGKAVMGGVKRQVSGRKSAAAEAAVAVEVVEAAGEEAVKPALRSNHGKEGREKKTVGKWACEDAKDAAEMLAVLQEQWAGVASEELHAKLFDKDFKRQVEGFRELAAFVAEHPQELTENLDLLLKMCTLRMVGKVANMSLVLSVLDLLKVILETLVASEYRFTEPEAAVFLPCMMEEVGGNHDTVRKAVRELVKKSTQVYPASKIFAFALDAVHHTRNQRARAENLAEMAALIERLGLEQVCMPAKALPALAAYVSERDVAVRNAACDCMAAAYLSVGEKLWKFLARSEQKDKDMIEARLKKAQKGAPNPAPPSAAHEPARPSSRLAAASPARQSAPSLADAQQQQQQELSSSAGFRKSVPSLQFAGPGAGEGLLVTPEKAPPASDFLQAPTPTIGGIKSRYTAPEPAAHSNHGHGEVLLASAARSGVQVSLAVSKCMEALAVADKEGKVAGLKQLTAMIQQLGAGGKDGSAGALVREADALVEILHSNIAMELPRGVREEAGFRVVKHSLHAAHQLLTSLPEVVAAVSDQMLGALLEELLLRLHDPALQGDEELEVLMKGMNELVMDVLHFARANHVFTVLIRFLYEGAPLSGGREPSAEFVDGVLRCLLEMARRMSSFVATLDIDMLLYDAHMFLVAHPPSKYRGREFRPLRLLKTILNELVKIKGEGIRAHLSLIPTETKPTICSYLDLVLQQHAGSRTGSSSAGSSAGANNIAAIFEKIGSKDKDSAKEGFKLLFQYSQAHPEFSLQAYLSGRSPQFQEHVQKNLAKVQAQHQALAASRAAATRGGGTAAVAEPPLPLQNAMSASNKGSGLASSQSELSKSATGAGALLDKLQGIRSQLGIASATDPASEPASSTSSREEAAPAPASPTPGGSGGAGPTTSSISVMSLQERLAKLKS